MATIAENLQIIKDSTNDIKLAILDNGGEITGGIVTYADSISNLFPKESDIIFYDYDGTVLYSYTKNKFLSLTSLPDLPSQPGLICQGWNWTFEDAIAYVQKYGKLNIGATYITDDGKTRLYINLLNDGMSISLHIIQSVENGVTVEWGDGNSETVSGTDKVTVNHTYDKAGSYTISLTVNSGTCILGWLDNSSYNVMGAYNTISSGSLYKVLIGSNTTIGGYAFNECTSLQSITISDSAKYIGESAFWNCNSLQSISIPNSVTLIFYSAFAYCISLQTVTIPNSVEFIYENAFGNCTSLQSITISNSVTMIGWSAFLNCTSLRNVVIPDSVTEIHDSAFAYCLSLQTVTISNSEMYISSNAFGNCTSLQSITISNSEISTDFRTFSGCDTLHSVTISNSEIEMGGMTFSNCKSLQNITILDSIISIGESAFSDCTSLQSINIPDSVTVTSICSSVFLYCHFLQSVIIPDSITIIDSAVFESCASLRNVVIPDSVTRIGLWAFSDCTSLRSIAIPNSVKYIESGAFNGCHGMQYYDFTSHTSIPTLSNTDAFDGISTGCEIRVPAALYEEWKAATNWSTYADYIVPYEG